MVTVQAVRGMNDILPGVSAMWQHVEGVLRSIFHTYSYREIRLPLLEKTELFARSIGENTDIVAKEMYTFEDRNGDSLTLRPEATASCARAGMQHGLFHNQSRRLWYLGPMFRHERPQRGRYRQFYQAGAEAFGWDGPDTDAELILLSARFWRELGLKKQPQLEINSLGDLETRHRYREQLVAYLLKFEHELDADSRQRLATNPLRVLDSKDANTRSVLADAPDIMQCMDTESSQHFNELCRLLRESDVPYTINNKLVRGLDYYNRTVFEWVTDELGAQSAVCAGGRYDGLAQQLGSKRRVPACGFALGLDRLVELVLVNEEPTPVDLPDVYVMMAGQAPRQQGWRYAEYLRDQGYKVEMSCGEASLKSQMKRADKSGAAIGLLLGEDEINAGSVTLKLMRQRDEQITIPAAELAARLQQIV